MDIVSTSYDPAAKVWSGQRVPTLFNTDLSVGTVIYATMKNYPNNICQICDTDGITLTNKEVLTMGIRIARFLQKIGLTHKDVVGILGRNTTYTTAVAIGCLLNGTPFNAVNPALEEASLIHIYGITKPKVIFCDGNVYDELRSCAKQLKALVYTLIDHREDVPSVLELLQPSGDGEESFRPVPLVEGPDQTMAILNSSGTTGLPKAVCLSNHYLFAMDGSINVDDVIYNAIGLEWATGLYFFLHCCLQGCTRIVTYKPFSTDYFVDLVVKYKMTYVVLAPRSAAALLDCPKATSENLSSLRIINLTGGGARQPTIERLQKLMPNCLISFGYGMTELGYMSRNFGSDQCHSVGKLLPNILMRIVNDDGVDLPHNEVGEIYARNGRNWNGYFGNEEETKKSLDSDGWFHTGDLGYFDDNNSLYVVDRKKDICKYDGIHYWPAEIEEAIAELEDVVDVCVVTVDEETHGDVPGAVVVKAKGSSITEDDIVRHVAQRLVAKYKQLHAGVLFVDKLPQNANGKTLKKEAQTLFHQNKTRRI